MDLFLLILRLLIAVVFSVAAFAKVADLRGSAKAMAGFGVPERLSLAFSTSLVVAELVIAAELLADGYAWSGAIGAAALLIIFTSSMAYHYFKGNDQDCHCFGQLVREPVGAASLIRNSILLAISLFLVSRGPALQGRELSAVSRDEVSVILEVAGLGLLLILAAAARKILAGQADIAKRIEELETLGLDGGEVSRDDAGSPDDGLPIGALLPRFELPDISGELQSNTGLLAAGKPLLVFFVSPSCSPCRAMVGEFDDWQETLGDRFTLLFVSSGKPLDNAEKFNREVEKLVVLQSKRELSEAMMARWTPSAVLVRPDGRIASSVAAGDQAIRDLVHWARHAKFDDPLSYYSPKGVNAGKVGERLPERTVETVDGGKVSLSELTGKSTLMAFWGSGCPHCHAMRDDLVAWASSASNGDPQVIVFTDDNDFPSDFAGQVVADPEYSAAAELGMHGTPSAILVNSDGVIASETAVGAPQIWALVGRSNVSN